MIKCLTCGTNNLEGSQYCDECGNPLNATKGAETEANPPAPADYNFLSSGNITSVGIPSFVEELKKEENISAERKNNQDSNGGVRAKLIIERGDAVGTEFPVSATESNIGRWDADNGIFPDIDLDSLDAEAKISRRHARIIHENDRFLIEDLGSTNGTFVNRGRRLLPGTPHLLNDGDEIIVGKTFLRFRLN